MAVVALLAGCVVLSGQTTAAASPTDAAFNSGSGSLNVNRAGYLSKHDIVHNRPNTNPLHGPLALELSLWDLNSVQNIADVPNLDTWRQASTFADTSGVGLSRGQNDPNGFGHTLAATVEGANYTSQVVNGTRVRLTITPTAGYTVWFTAASRKNAAGQNSVQQARNQLASVKQAGYATTLNNYRNWWHDFWGKSFVQYGGSADNDYLENAYYLATYTVIALSCAALLTPMAASTASAVNRMLPPGRRQVLGERLSARRPVCRPVLVQLQQ